MPVCSDIFVCSSNQPDPSPAALNAHTSPVRPTNFHDPTTNSLFPCDSPSPSTLSISTFISAGLFIMFVKLLIPVLLAVSSTVTPVVSLATPESSTNFARDGYGGPPEVNSTVKFPAPFNDTAKRFPDIQLLWEGNEAFRSEIANSSNPNQLKDLVTNGHRPEFLFLGCRFVISPLSDFISAADLLGLPGFVTIACVL